MQGAGAISESGERNGKQFTMIAFVDTSRESREFFSHQENGQDRIPPNVERFRRKYVYYVNSRDKNQVNAIQEIEIKILIVQNNYTVTNDN